MFGIPIPRLRWKMKWRNLRPGDLLERLDALTYEKGEELEQDSLEQMNLSRVLLQLAHINCDSLYSVCRTVAKHLRGSIPDPERLDAQD